MRRWLNGVNFRPNVAMSRGYGWRGGCSAADVPDGGVGSVEWFGRILLIVDSMGSISSGPNP